MSRSPDSWWASERRIERLTEMRAAGTTYEKIAAELGTTKSACIGAGYRLGLPQSVNNKKDEERLSQEPAFPPQPTGSQCRWPLWVEEITHEYRLAPVAIYGLSYCREHAKRAYQDAKLRRL